MEMAVGGKRSVVSDPNIVPLIDVLLVLRVIFMLMPHSRGFQAQIPQACGAQGAENCGQDKPHIVVVQVLANGSLRLNQVPVKWENLGTRLRGVFKVRSEEHTSELQSQSNLVCRLLLEKKKRPRHRLHVRQG